MIDQKDKEQDEATNVADRHDPSEFAAFVRGVGVRALDALADRVERRTADPQKKQPKPVRKIVEYWQDMSLEQKERFFDQMIAAAQALAAAAPAVFAVKRAKKALKATAATKKGAKKAAPKKKTTAEKPAAKKSTKKSSTKSAATKKAKK